MKVVGATDLVAELVPGTILWRDFGVYGDRHGNITRIKMEDVPFDKAANGQYVARTLFHSRGICEPVVWYKQQTGNPREDRTQGVVTFVKKLPPPDWNFLVVTGVSSKGTSIYTEHRKVFPQDNYIELMMAYAKFMANDRLRNGRAEDKLAKTMEECPINLSGDLQRIFVDLTWIPASNDGPKRAGFAFEYLPRQFEPRKVLVPKPKHILDSVTVDDLNRHSDKFFDALKNMS